MDRSLGISETTLHLQNRRGYKTTEFTVETIKQETTLSLFSPSSSPPPRLLTLAAYNVRSLLDNSMSNPPERRTALVARELAHHKLNIAALSETYFSKQDQLEEMGAGYTFFWSGCSRQSDETRASPSPPGTTSWDDCPV
ncbi:hypothetical protein SprV_0301206500 [Sparganum proliferum]